MNARRRSYRGRVAYATLSAVSSRLTALMDIASLVEIAAFVVVAGALGWMAMFLRRSAIGEVFAFVCCVIGAYSIALTLEVCTVQVMGLVPGKPSVVITWGLLGFAGFLIAAMAQPSGWMAMVPCCVIGTLMMLHGPLTADPFADLRFGVAPAGDPIQYPAVVGHVAFAVGVVMMFFSVIAALAVGVGRDPPALPVNEIAAA